MESEDTLSWIKKSKKREKELAKKRQQEQEALDKQAQEEYTESEFTFMWSAAALLIRYLTFEEDLAGLKVSHDFEGLAEGEDRILTLKDSRILDNEGTLSF